MAKMLFSSAYNAAANGDVITLSSGTFNAINIGKSITIRGAGCVLDTVTNVLPTIIPGNFGIRANNITCEGFWFTGQVSISDWSHYNYSTFIKCNINRVWNSPGIMRPKV